MFLVIVARLFSLQVLSSKYGTIADMQSTFRKVIYPDRGIIFDRKRKVMLQNTNIYDLMVIPVKAKGIDTLALCNILGIDTATFRKRMVDLIFKNTKLRESVFEPLLSDEKIARINEALYRFEPGFFLQQRPVRSYPYDAAANVLGYLAEVDSNFLKRHKDGGYLPGDYAGMTGIERSYEKVLMGQRGIQYWKRDNKNRLTEKLEKGRYDTAAVAGSNMYSSIDIELQALGEKLMQNKLGSIVAVDPKTGGVLAMISAPTYQPKFLTGGERRKHFSKLYKDPGIPLLNRAVNAIYSPGSTFKTLQALVGLHEGVINTHFTVSCGGAFFGCGGGNPMKCLDRGTFDLLNAIRVSDNTYFATVMQRVINNPKYPNVDSSLASWDRYMNAFGLGHKLGIDIPTEQTGNIPTPADFNKKYGQGHWNYCTFRSVSIGQGEVNVTPLQVANEMAYIANKGWYIVPHIIDSIAGGDQFHMLDKYKQKVDPTDIPDSIFDVVHEGMQRVVEGGTGAGAKVEGITVCGKTGTVENYYKGVKQQNHSFFCGFAPRENPRIAIMCVVENSGRFGGTYAAPIVGLMIEKYLKDSITDKARLARIEQLANLNLLPPRIFTEMRRIDSLDHAKDTSYLIQKGYIRQIKDTLETEDEPDLVKEDDKTKVQEDSKKKKDSVPALIKPEAILPDNKRKAEQKDSLDQ